MKRLFYTILFLLSTSLLFAQTDSVTGNLKVAYGNELPSGLFAKASGYLPGDLITLTNPVNGKTVQLLNLGSVDASSGNVVLVSSEAASQLGLSAWDSMQVSLNQRSSSDSASTGSATITKISNSSTQVQKTQSVPTVQKNDDNSAAIKTSSSVTDNSSKYEDSETVYSLENEYEDEDSDFDSYKQAVEQPSPAEVAELSSENKSFEDSIGQEAFGKWISDDYVAETASSNVKESAVPAVKESPSISKTENTADDEAGEPAEEEYTPFEFDESEELPAVSEEEPQKAVMPETTEENLEERKDADSVKNDDDHVSEEEPETAYEPISVEAPEEIDENISGNEGNPAEDNKSADENKQTEDKTSAEELTQESVEEEMEPFAADELQQAELYEEDDESTEKSEPADSSDNNEINSSETSETEETSDEVTSEISESIPDVNADRTPEPEENTAVPERVEEEVDQDLLNLEPFEEETPSAPEEIPAAAERTPEVAATPVEDKTENTDESTAGNNSYNIDDESLEKEAETVKTSPAESPVEEVNEKIPLYDNEEELVEYEPLEPIAEEEDGFERIAEEDAIFDAPVVSESDSREERITEDGEPVSDSSYKINEENNDEDGLTRIVSDDSSLEAQTSSGEKQVPENEDYELINDEGDAEKSDPFQSPVDEELVAIPEEDDAVSANENTETDDSIDSDNEIDSETDSNDEAENQSESSVEQPEEESVNEEIDTVPEELVEQSDDEAESETKETVEEEPVSKDESTDEENTDENNTDSAPADTASIEETSSEVPSDSGAAENNNESQAEENQEDIYDPDEPVADLTIPEPLYSLDEPEDKNTLSQDSETQNEAALKDVESVPEASVEQEKNDEVPAAEDETVFNEDLDGETVESKEPEANETEYSPIDLNPSEQVKADTEYSEMPSEEVQNPDTEDENPSEDVQSDDESGEEVKSAEPVEQEDEKTEESSAENENTESEELSEENEVVEDNASGIEYEESEAGQSENSKTQSPDEETEKTENENADYSILETQEPDTELVENDSEEQSVEETEDAVEDETAVESSEEDLETSEEEENEYPEEKTGRVIPVVPSNPSSNVVSEPSEDNEETESEEDNSDYAPIVLIPAGQYEAQNVTEVSENEQVEDNPLENDETSSETNVILTESVESESPVIELNVRPANGQTENRTTVTPSVKETIKAHTVDNSSISTVKYYIQIATMTDEANIASLIEKYSKYPVVLVPVSGGNAYKVLVGPLSEDEYGVVLARFKAYGFKDAFVFKKK